jgi:hypothetical protein
VLVALVGPDPTQAATSARGAVLRNTLPFAGYSNDVAPAPAGARADTAGPTTRKAVRGWSTASIPAPAHGVGRFELLAGVDAVFPAVDAVVGEVVGEVVGVLLVAPAVVVAGVTPVTVVAVVGAVVVAAVVVGSVGVVVDGVVVVGTDAVVSTVIVSAGVVSAWAAAAHDERATTSAVTRAIRTSVRRSRSLAGAELDTRSPLAVSERTDRSGRSASFRLIAPTRREEARARRNRAQAQRAMPGRFG